MNWFLVFIGGGLGSLVRYGISLLLLNQQRIAFPVATLVSNVFSCLVLSLVLFVSKEYVNSNALIKALIVVGFCGGFSTFSTFSYETVVLLKSGNTSFALMNIGISVTLCLGIIYYFYKDIPS